MKKAISILLIFTFIFTLCACKKTTGEETTTEAEAASETVSVEATEPTITDTLYVVLKHDANNVTTNAFSFQGGQVTPSRIAAGLTCFTCWNFRVNSQIDEDNNAIKIDFLSESSFVTGEPHPQLEARFPMENDTELKIFMMDSIAKTIMETMGDYDIFFTAEGNAIEDLEGVSSDKPYAI